MILICVPDRDFGHRFLPELRKLFSSTTNRFAYVQTCLLFYGDFS